MPQVASKRNHLPEDGRRWSGETGTLRNSSAILGVVMRTIARAWLVAFGGPGHDELCIVTADNLDDPAKGGSIFRTKPGVAGVPTPLARV